MKSTLNRPARFSAKARDVRVGARVREFLGNVRRDGTAESINVKQFCNSYQVTQETFTRLTGFSPRAVAHWASGSKPSGSTARRLTEMRRIFQALEELVPPGSIGPWLKEPNQAFDGSTPLQ